jgi:cysteinyl-tRNA synthetase
MKLYNTLTRTKEDFLPIEGGRVKLYTCGPTVYDNLQIGNWRNQVFNDTLTRTLLAAGFKVHRVMNITDVGHLVSDADEGEDKLEKGALREGKSAWEVANHYTQIYHDQAELLNLQPATNIIRATDAIESQIALIQKLFDNGFVYQTEQAIYFDVTKLADYGKLSGQKLEDKEVGARSEVVTDPQKHHPQDFAVWFFTIGHFAKHEMRWNSPWGEGFPGWHLECSAIIHQALGEPIDIHTGGVDHIGTHHTNEIAQSEAAFDVALAKYWVHNEFLTIDGQRMGKSQGNFYTLPDVMDKGFDPLALRLLYLQAHYRTQQNFTWEALAAAQNRLTELYAWADLVHQHHPTADFAEFEKHFATAMKDDLDTPKALALLSSALEQPPTHEVLQFLDDYLGLQFGGRPDITPEQKAVIAQRQAARQNKDFAAADHARDQLLKQGIEIEDGANGPRWRRV